ncbi:MAG: SMC family ATPase [Armatimonadetes bacterium]|nr:SMC family ATPase [Armatimonadota bacterium]
MVPIKLRLRNFMSYGENVSPLDFTTFDLACLSGSNGHGKSALLDAITWALWGEARKARGRTSPDEDLIRIGAQEMEVEFEFEVEGDRYRVIRRYSRKHHRRTGLELHAYSVGDNRWITLTGRSQHETQQRINSTLRMDYETFIASSFILQGRADEFTRRTPGERKEILASILGLDHYERLSELAREHQKECASSEQAALNELDRIDEELKQLPNLEERARQLDEELNKVNEGLRSVADRLDGEKKRLATLEERRRQLESLRWQAKELFNNFNTMMEQYKSWLKRYKELKDILNKESEIKSNYERYQEAARKGRELEGKLKELRELETNKRKIEQAIERVKGELEKQLAELRKEGDTLRREINEAMKLVNRRQEIERGYEELQSLKRKDKHLESLRRRHSELRELATKIKMEIDGVRLSLETQLKSILRQCKEIESEANQKEELESEIARLNAQLEELRELQKEADSVASEIIDCDKRISELSFKQTRLEDEIKDTEVKLNLLVESTEPRCPVCDSPLDEERKGKLKADFESSLDNMRSELEAITSEIVRAMGQRSDLQLRYGALEGRLKSMGAVQQRLANAEARLEKANEAAKKLERLRGEAEELKRRIKENDFAAELRERLMAVENEISQLGYDEELHLQVKDRLESMGIYETEMELLRRAQDKLSEAEGKLNKVKTDIALLQKRIAEGDFAHDEQRQLAELNRLIDELGYDELEHDKVRKEQERLESYVGLYERLSQAKVEIPKLLEQLRLLRQSIKNGHKRYKELVKQIKALEKELQAIPQVKQGIMELEGKHSELDRKRLRLQSEKGEVESNISRCKGLSKRREEIESDLQRLRHEKRIYELLTQAFGKDGIQAIIIGNAISEVEEEANNLLGRLTRNRVHVAFELQRETKGGTPKETLDIKVSDELGTRPYELYSGGERFRIDFAIRVALAKLLARRAGTSVRFLVIDEGFGSQDADGLKHLVEAINSIKSDFDKIIVVTHLEQLKDSFPVRIEVTKDPHTGSQFEIIRM